MSDEITFFVPGRPFSKKRPRFGKGRTYTDPETVAAEQAIRWYAKRAFGAQDPWVGPLEMVVEFVFEPAVSWSIKRRAAADWHTFKPDIDNLEKLCDSMNAVVWVDDSQICVHQTIKRYAEMGEQEGTWWSVRKIKEPTKRFRFLTNNF